MTRSLLATGLATLVLAACGGGGSSDSSSGPPSAEADPISADDPNVGEVFLTEPRDTDCRQSIALYEDVFGVADDRLFIDGAPTGSPSSETLFFAGDGDGGGFSLIFEWGPGITGCRGTLG